MYCASMSGIIIATAQAKAHKRCGEQCTNLTVNKRYFPPTQRRAIPHYQSQSLLGCQQDVLYVPIHVCPWVGSVVQVHWLVNKEILEMFPIQFCMLQLEGTRISDQHQKQHLTASERDDWIQNYFKLYSYSSRKEGTVVSTRIRTA